MPLMFSSKGSGDAKRVSPGSHFAVCDMVVFLGMQHVGGAFPKDCQQLYIRYEVPAERWEYEKDGKKMEGPAVIGRSFTASMHKKAALRKFLEGWRGRTFTDDEASNFDIAKVLGQSCMLTVTEQESGGTIYSNLTGVSGLPKGAQKVKAELPLYYYAPDDTSCYDSLPQWLRDKIDNQITKKTETEKIADYNPFNQSPDAQVPIEAYSDVVPEEDNVPF